MRQAARLLHRTGEAERAADLLSKLPAGGEPWVIGLLEASATRAAEADDHATARARLTRALQEPMDAPDRGRLLIALGDAHGRDGSSGAVESYVAALRWLGPEDAPGVRLRLGRAHFGVGKYREAARELDLGLEAVDPGADALRTELLAAYVAATRFDRTLEDAAARHLLPLMQTVTPGRTAAERALLAELALEHGIRGQSRETVVGLAQRAWADGLMLEGADEWGITVSQVAAALTWSDAFAESEAMLTAVHESAERRGCTLLSASARYLRAWPRWYQGALVEAEADTRAALDAPGWTMYEASARAVLGHILFDRGDPAGAEEALELSDPSTWERTLPYAMLLAARARLRFSADRFDLVVEDLEEVGRLLETMGNQSPFCPWRSQLGLALAGLGDVDGGRALIAHELEQATRIGVPRARGVALTARASLTDDASAALADLRTAAELHQAAGARVERARTLTDLGSLLVRSGAPSEARGPLHEASRLARVTGAGDLAARAERELRGAGGRRPRLAGDDPSALTASEHRVAQMAAHGATNREIATRLFISPHTVRFHLTSVYRKLGVDARDDLSDALRGPELSRDA